MNSKHQSHKISASLLDDIIASVVGPNKEVLVENAQSNEEPIVEATVTEAGDMGNEANKAAEKDASNPEEDFRQISDYERARNERVALMRAEFLLRFPTFEKDLHELKVTKTGVKKTRKPKVINV